jgi:dTDP-4-amino-4,6-dideoxygalactose transaminase
VKTVPFFRVELSEAEIAEVVDTLRSGWLTTGPKTRRFEEAFAASVGATHALALNSCTAALHVAVEALGIGPGDGVLVPTMTFAATAEVVRYLSGVPVLVDCEPGTCNIDLGHAEQILADHGKGIRAPGMSSGSRIVGVMPVHYGGDMVDVGAVRTLAARHGLWVVEDAAHAFPAAWRPSEDAPWQRCGDNTGDVTCFSFYANKTITTGEGGMAVTSSPGLADRMRRMSLHGLSHDAWGRYTSGGAWDYRIVDAGYKYNLTDIASALGLHQLRRAEELRQARETRAGWYTARLASSREVMVPFSRSTRQHAWHLYPIQLRTEALPVTRDQVMSGLRSNGVTASVHWRPLHLHPYYQERFGYAAGHCPAATAVFDRNLSLPLFPGLTVDEVDYVVAALQRACEVPATV